MEENNNIKRILALKVPSEFFKDTEFYCDENDLRVFLSSIKGFIDCHNELDFLEGMDIDKTISSYSGSARIWYKQGYGDFYPKIVFMDCKDQYCEDIYDWMKIFTPTLYKQHIEYDKVEPKEKSSRGIYMRDTVLIINKKIDGRE